jgi:hypothetical protein
MACFARHGWLTMFCCMSLGCTTTANRSLPNDAGADADTSVDAGPCGGGCSGATPYCNEATDQCERWYA